MTLQASVEIRYMSDMMKRSLVVFCCMVSACLSCAGQTGPIFLFEQFVKAKVHFKNRATAVYPMNYDANGGKMYFVQDGKNMEVTNVNTIDSVSWPGRVFIPDGRRFLEIQRLPNGIVYIDWLIKEVHLGKKGVFGLPSQGTIQNLRLYDFGGGTTGYSPYQNQGTYATDMWRRKNGNTYYIMVNGKRCRVRNVNGVCKLFPEHEEEIKAYARDEKLDMADPLSALHLLNYCLQWAE